MKKIVKLIALLSIAIYLMMGLTGCGDSTFKKQIVTSENVNEIIEGAETELEEDEKYYLIYEFLKNAFTSDKLYGKTVKELIKLGKEDMKKDNYSIAKVKEEWENLFKTSEKTDNDSYNISHTLSIIQSEFVVGIWNELFCNVDHYLESGTNAYGGEFNYDEYINKADKIMSKRNDYNEFINGLDSNEYREVKELWNKILPEIDRLYNKVKQVKPMAKDKNYEFSTDSFKTYMYDFMSLQY